MRLMPMLVVAGLGLGLMGGCSAGVKETGVRIGDETLKQFKAGNTTEAWLIAVLGPPTTQSVVEGVENTRVLRYASGEQTSGFIAALAGASTKSTAVTYFIVTNGIVTRFWADRSKDSTLFGGTAETDPGAKKAE